MTFPTIVFGTGSVPLPGNITFTPGSSISAGGYSLFIVPQLNIGPSGLDLSFTYTNQFGVQKTTSVATSVAGITTAGTHIQVILEPGDSGIQSLISVSLTGGNVGDSLSFQSWNEGSGRPNMPVSYSTTLTGTYLPEPTLIRSINVSLIDKILADPVLLSSNPVIQVPIPLVNSNIIAFSPDVIVNRDLVSNDFVTQIADIVGWSPNPYGERTFNGISIQTIKSWLESVVGQVLSGYVTNINSQIILNAFSLVLISSSTPGASTTSDVNPNTGFYQAFLKSIVYDERYIIVKIGLENIALTGAGLPSVVDGTTELPEPYNLQFACPVKNCDFTVTRQVT